jgi:hypothetical protein
MKMDFYLTTISSPFSAFPDHLLGMNVIISFHEGMKAAVLSDGDFSDPFDVCNGTKQGCVMPPVLFALFFSVRLPHAFSECDACRSPIPISH